LVQILYKENIVFLIFFEGARKQKGKGGRIVIITDISKEVENNTIARLHTYGRKYVSRQNGASGGSNAGGGSSGRS